MKQKLIDIHNFSKKEQTAKQHLLEATISERNKELIMEFVDDLQVGGIGKPRIVKTISMVKCIALKFGKDFTSADEHGLKGLIKSIQNDDSYSVWTKQDYCKILKKFYRWMIRKGYSTLNVDWIPTTLKAKDKPKLKRSELLTEEEAHKIVEVSEHARDKALTSLIWDTGARIGEIGSMTIGSVHFEDGGTSVDLKGKTGSRTVFVIESTPHLLTWLKLHPFRDDLHAPLWVTMGQDRTYKYQPLRYRTFYKIFERAFKNAGVKKSWNPHLYRHSRALWCVLNNWNTIMANKFFGWGDTSHMYSYYVSLANEDVKEKMMQSYGVSTKKDEELAQRTPRRCVRCEALNEPKVKFCYRCGMALDLKTMLSVEEKRKSADKLMSSLVRDPEVQKVLVQKIREMGLEL
jgi:integrase